MASCLRDDILVYAKESYLCSRSSLRGQGSVDLDCLDLCDRACNAKPPFWLQNVRVEFEEDY